MFAKLIKLFLKYLAIIFDMSKSYKSWFLQPFLKDTHEINFFEVKYQLEKFTYQNVLKIWIMNMINVLFNLFKYLCIHVLFVVFELINNNRDAQSTYLNIFSKFFQFDITCKR